MMGKGIRRYGKAHRKYTQNENDDFRRGEGFLQLPQKNISRPYARRAGGDGGAFLLSRKRGKPYPSRIHRIQHRAEREHEENKDHVHRRADVYGIHGTAEDILGDIPVEKTTRRSGIVEIEAPERRAYVFVIQ